MSEGDPPTVLIVDDDPVSLTLLGAHLRGSGHEVLTATNGIEAMEILLTEGPPMVITDWMMPEMDGLELCRRIRAHEGVAFAYIIIVTAHSDEDRIVEAFNAGADDYLPKPFKRKELLARVRAGSRIVQLQADLDRRNREVHLFNAEMAVAHSKLHDANEKLRFMATTDELTGLVNRRAALERLQQDWMSADRHDEPLACVMFDIDHFKSVNDTYGHAVGDLVLKEIADVLRSVTRGEDQVSRIGGEEFLLVCPKASEQEAAIGAERVRQGIQAHEIRVDQETIEVTVSLGVAERKPGMCSPDELLVASDAALYAAKRGGRNTVCLASECEEKSDSEETPVDAPADTGVPVPVSARPNDAARILIVARDRHLRTTCRELLKREGYAISEAGNRRDALDKIGDDPPAVIITEPSVPPEITLEWLQTLKEHIQTRDSIVLCIISDNKASDLASAFTAGADDCISRAGLGQGLVDRVRNALHSREQRAELIRSQEVRGEQSRAMNLLLDFSRNLVSTESLDDVLDQTINVTAELAFSRRVSIMLPDAKRQHLSVARAVGIDEQVVANIQVPIGAGISGRVFESGDPVVGNTEEEVGNRDPQYDSEFFVSVPLVCQVLAGSEYTVGVLNVSERHGGVPFGALEIEFIGLVCNVAAAAIHERLTRRSRDAARDSVVIALATLAEYRDTDTGRHVDRVARFCRVLAEELRALERFRGTITDQFLNDILHAVPLHDIGKVAIPDAILLKPGSLTDEEITVMRTHAEIGATTLRSVNERAPGATFLRMAEEIAHAHHEWYDGNGYPRGLRGAEISLAARIAALADVYDALTTKRPYKEAMSHERAAEIIISTKERQFDPDIVEAFRRRQGDFQQLAIELADDAIGQAAQGESPSAASLKELAHASSA